MKPLFLVAAILFSIAGSASAQDLHGSITGKGVDPQQAVIPAVAVVVTHAETGAVSRTQTNRDGYFEVNLLNPGHYSVTLEAAGFKKLTRTGSSWTSAGDWKLHSSSRSLWMARVDDFLAGGDTLTVADLSNRKTHQANHNTRTLTGILAEFRAA